MPGIWNSIGTVIDGIFDPEDEERRRKAYQTANPGDQPSVNSFAANPALTTEPDAQTALSNAHSPAPGIRKMFSLSAGSGVNQPDIPGTGAGQQLAQKAALLPLSATPDTPPAKPLSPLEADMAAIRDTEAKGPDIAAAKKRSGFSRFWRGAGTAWKEWTPQHGGGIFGLVGEMLGQGIDEGAHPQSRAERVQQQLLRKQFGRLQQDQAVDEAGQKQQIDHYKTIKEMNDARGAGITADLKMPEYNRGLAQDEQKKLEGNRKVVFDAIYGQQDEFDPTDPKNAEHVAELKAAKIPVIHKKKGIKLEHVVLPNGDFKVFNPSTGETVDKGNYAKPEKITKAELPDTLFGLPEDKEITDQAASRVGKEPAGKRLKPEAEAALKNYTTTDESGATVHPYQNSDGSVNTQAYWNDVMDGNAMMKPAEAYEGDVSDYSQKLAGERNRLRGQYKERRAAVDLFRTALETHHPSSDATAVPIRDIVEGFNRILNIKDAKKRKTAIDQWHKNILPHIKVGG